MLTLTPAPPSEDAGGADAGPRPRYTVQKRRGVTAGPVLQLGIMADPRRPGLLCLGAEGVRLYSLPHLLLRAEAASSRGAAAFAWEPGAQLLAVAQKKKCVARLLVDGLSWWGRVVVVLGGGGSLETCRALGPGSGARHACSLRHHQAGSCSSTMSGRSWWGCVTSACPASRSA